MSDLEPTKESAAHEPHITLQVNAMVDDLAFNPAVREMPERQLTGTANEQLIERKPSS